MESECPHFFRVKMDQESDNLSQCKRISFFCWILCLCQINFPLELYKNKFLSIKWPQILLFNKQDSSATNTPKAVHA